MTLLTIRRILLASVLGTLAAAAWIAPAIASAHGAAQTGGSGTITGIVVNGSRGNAPVAGQTVTLDVFVSHAQAQSAATTTTDAHGRFTFTSLDTSSSSVYQLDARYDNGDFASAPIGFDSGVVQRQTVTVYDTTSDASVLSVTNTTMLFSPPDTKRGLLPVGVFITFKNSGNLAFASATAPAGGKPMSLLRFALPLDAQDLALGAGFSNVQVIQVDKGFAAFATIPPGTTQFAYVYYLPYTGTDYSFQFKAVYPTAAVTLLVPTDMFVDDGDYAAKPPVQALGQKYQLLEADSVQAGEVLTTRLWNLPVPGEQPGLDVRQLQILGAALALLLALLVGFYLKRGNLAAALRLVPASAQAKPAAYNGQDREAERRRLLKVLLALEKQHASGRIGDAEYQQRRENMRRKLKTLLAESIVTESPNVVAGPESKAAEPTLMERAEDAQSLETVEHVEADDSRVEPVRQPPAGAPKPRRRQASVGGRR